MSDVRVGSVQVIRDVPLEPTTEAAGGAPDGALGSHDATETNASAVIVLDSTAQGESGHGGH
jgi:hypothetical protein